MRPPYVVVRRSSRPLLAPGQTWFRLADLLLRAADAALRHRQRR